MNLESDVVGHYAHGALALAIRQGLVTAGKDPERLTPADLAPIDEFHLGGGEATAALFAQLGLHAGMRWLDIGSGLGGAARHLAASYGCIVSGIDLTPEYVEVAGDLARRVGLAGLVDFRQSSALALPFPDGSFDGASLLHVGMNIPHKFALAAGVARVLRPGGIFAIYDVCAWPRAIAFPLPWAAGPAMISSPRRGIPNGPRGSGSPEPSAAAPPFAWNPSAMQAGRSRGRPALGLHILMGENARQKTGNLVQNLERGLVAPMEIIAARR